MKLWRYIIRGVEDIVRELTGVKRIVKPKKVKPPTVGRVEEILRYLTINHSLFNLSLFDPNGVHIASANMSEQSRGLFEQILPIFQELNARYLFVRRSEGWITLFKRRGFYLLLESPYKPDVVDLWVIGREFERYMWGSVWED